MTATTTSSAGATSSATATSAVTDAAQAAAELPVIVIGAGPVGLAAAAHLLERGLEPLVLEAGDDVAAAVRAWSHIRLFSPWRYNVDAAAARLLEPTGWEHPKLTGLPTGADLVEQYLAPLAATEALAPRIRTRSRVLAVSRVGLDKTHSRGRDERPFLVRVQHTDELGGTRIVDHHARAVLDASGTFEQRNPLGVSGLPAIGETEAAPFMAGPLPDVSGVDRDRFAGRRVLVVGAGHSATNTLLHLVALAEKDPAEGAGTGARTHIIWAVRGASVERTFGGGDLDGLPARGALGSRLRQAVESGRIELHTEVTVSTLELSTNADGNNTEVAVVAKTPAGEQRLVVDVIAAATGFRPELAMLRELRLDLDPGVEAPSRLAPMIDPEFHSCGTVAPHGADVLAHPETGFFIAGMKSYGRAPTFLLATGYEQVRSIAAHLAGDEQAAADLQLDLPETGVCSTSTPVLAADGTLEVDDSATAGSCCGTSAPQPVSIGIGAGVGAGIGAGVGFATGFLHGRSGEAAQTPDQASAPSSGGCC